MVLFVVISIIIILNRFYYEERKLIKDNIDFVVNDFFARVLFHTKIDELDDEIKKFKKEIPYRKTWVKRVLMEKIITLKKNLKGKSSESLIAIYEKFGLLKYTKSLISDSRWHIKCKGIYQLQILEYEKGQDLIKPYLNSSNEILRSNAFIAYLSTTSKSIDFLGDYKQSISLIDELKFVDLLSMKKFPLPKNIDKWLASSNVAIVRIGLKFIVYHNNTEYNKLITGLLKSENRSIRHEVIKAIESLQIVNTEDILLHLFPNEDKLNKIAIISALSKIGETNTLKYFEKYFKENQDSIDTDIKIKTVECIQKIDAGFLENSFKDNLEIERIKNHLANKTLA
ncbi:MAG: hypothetical protein CO119_11715 [Flavobacteriales bacterium CG_4_9_14_3_um_filter_40_17]|nr:MAG: hypothetical protein CO119_11715 [Flavobacteriales bacterium CG_4_9_14_3_um_filter_40_17]